MRGAQGELALDVIRPGGDDTIRVTKSQFETAGNVAPHRFRSDLAVERGDQIGLQMGPGARIGVRERMVPPPALAAACRRLLRSPRPRPGNRLRPRGARARGVRGQAKAGPADELSGAAAARAPDGKLRLRERSRSRTRGAAWPRVREVGQRVALDLVRGGRRVERVFLPGLRPGGDPINDRRRSPSDGEPYGGVDVRWVNLNSGRMTSTA